MVWISLLAKPIQLKNSNKHFIRLLIFFSSEFFWATSLVSNEETQCWLKSGMRAVRPNSDQLRVSTFSSVCSTSIRFTVKHRLTTLSTCSTYSSIFNLTSFYDALNLFDFNSIYSQTSFNDAFNLFDLNSITTVQTCLTWVR